MSKTVLVTGCAGFIGSHLVEKLIKKKYKVIGIDNFNTYYDPKIKERNIASFAKSKNFKLYKGDILDEKFLEDVFLKNKIDYIVHLAARAGVRPSIDEPLLYADVNKTGTLNLLTYAVRFKIKKFLFGSSSSVYGNNEKVPFSEDDYISSITSPYGASKRAAEVFIETFSKMYKLKSIILRFFTVYGPRGRPDMAPYIFTKEVIEGALIQQFGKGSSRDYTYIDDIVDGILLALESDLSFEIINLGNSKPIELSDFIKTIERVTGKKAVVEITESRAGDVTRTWASVEKARKLLDWKSKIDLEEGLARYVLWLKKNQ